MSYDHEKLVCDRCGEWQMLRPEKIGRICHMTPKCEGRVRCTIAGHRHPEPVVPAEAS